MRNNALLIYCAVAVLSLLCLVQHADAAVSPSAPHYVQDALIDGKLVQRWNDRTKVIRVNVQHGLKVKGWSKAKNALVKSAFTEWERAMGGRVRFMYTDSPYDTDIFVRWQQRSYGEIIGMNISQFDGSSTLMNTDIEIAMIDPVGRFHTDSQIRAIALHEIGHALGIKGHSANSNDIMYPTERKNIIHLSKRDIATIHALYKMPAHITNPVGISFAKYQSFLHFAKKGQDSLNRNDGPTAYEHFLSAQKFYNKNPYLPYYLGISAYMAQKYDAALASLKHAAQLPNHHQQNAQFYLANTLLYSGQADMKAGKVGEGQRKVQEAKAFYTALSKNPKASAEVRKAATESLAALN